MDEKDKEAAFNIGCLVIALILICFSSNIWHYIRNGLIFDLEKKDYQAIVFKDDLYLINKKNGKTYKYNDDIIGKYHVYSYTYITRPYKENNPLNLKLENKAR